MAEGDNEFEEFQVDIVGPKPQDVAFDDLAEFVQALEKAIAATLGTVEERDVALRLVGISEGSDRLTLAVARKAVPSVAQISARVRSAEYSALPRRAHAALSDMSRVVARRNWGFRFVRNQRLQIVKAEVPADQGIPPPKVEAIRGATTILARCMRVGGVEPRAELRLPNRESLLHVGITESQAKQLRVYEDVVLAGQATWDPATWEIVEFAVTGVTPYEATPVDVSFRELARSAGDTWSKVDADAFVKEQRAEPES